MLKIRATTVSRVQDSLLGEPSVFGRIEFSYNGSRWLNIGVRVYTEVEWLMLVSLLILGARTTSGVEVEHVVLETNDGSKPLDCATIG